MDWGTIIGIAGMILILWPFWMAQTHRWTADDFWYDLFNAAGSFLLIVTAWQAGSWPLVVLNAVWGGVSLWDVLFKDAPPHPAKHRRMFAHARRSRRSRPQ